MRKKRRDVETGSLSVLDVVCCGFGAVGGSWDSFIF